MNELALAYPKEKEQSKDDIYGGVRDKDPTQTTVIYCTV